MLSCRQATELMSQGLDRPLSMVERVALSLHKAICAGCRAVDRQMAALRRITAAWRQEHAAPGKEESGGDGRS